MPRYLLSIAYDGTAFHGWQRQELAFAPDQAEQLGWNRAAAWAVVGQRIVLRTVQHVVQQAVRAVAREPIELIGASRTDAGVHARGQAAAFTCSGDTAPAPAQAGTQGDASHSVDASAQTTPATRGIGWPSSRGTDRLVLAINSRLPGDVLVTACREVHAAFDPVADARRKRYTYTLHVGPRRAVFGRHYAHHVRGLLDVPAMARAAALLVGEHDFAGFAAAGHGRLTTVRRLYACTVQHADPEHVVIGVEGNGFLWNMVRIMCGTLLEVGMGRRDAAGAARALATKDRRDAGPTLPPTGLCLEWIEYPPSNNDTIRTAPGDAGQLAPDTGS